MYMYSCVCVCACCLVTPPNPKQKTIARPPHSLAGKVGTNDVEDLYLATRAALELKDPTTQQPLADAARVGIVGGSHGGFLGAHAIGAHPELFKAAALRNPVTNIASMVRQIDRIRRTNIQKAAAGWPSERKTASYT